MLAYYPLEGKALAINAERTKFAISDEEDYHKCIQSLTGFCCLRNAIYPENLSEHCMVALFMDNEEKIEQYCRKSVITNAVLPVAKQISEGLWAVTTAQLLRFNIVCENSVAEVPVVLQVNPPLATVNLNQTCLASNEAISLPPYFNFHSTIWFKEDFSQFEYNFNQSSVRGRAVSYFLPPV